MLRLWSETINLERKLDSSGRRSTSARGPLFDLDSQRQSLTTLLSVSRKSCKGNSLGKGSISDFSLVAKNAELSLFAYSHRYSWLCFWSTVRKVKRMNFFFFLGKNLIVQIGPVDSIRCWAFPNNNNSLRPFIMKHTQIFG